MYENEQKDFKFEFMVNTDNLEKACNDIEEWLEGKKQ
jgi:hypothetical protein